VDPYQTLSRKDPLMASLIEKHGKLRPQLKDKFFGLVEAIVWQQVGWKAALATVNKLKSLGTTPEAILSNSSVLPSLGLSRRKAEYIVNLAKLVSTGEINLHSLEKASDEEVIGRLTSIRGIGKWTAHMFLIFCLGREDVLPTGDLGILRSTGKLYFNGQTPSEDQLLELSERWRPFRTYASLYLWRSGRDEEGEDIPVRKL
jgi:DNA-3-methyladenine glycosylase II